MLFLVLFLFSCANAVYIQYNSDGFYETPKMNYKIKKVNDNLNINIYNKSTDRLLDVFETDILVVFKNDNNTVEKYNSIIGPIYPKETKNVTIKIPQKSNRAYIRYSEYTRGGGPLIGVSRDDGYSSYGTLYLSWVTN